MPKSENINSEQSQMANVSLKESSRIIGRCRAVASFLHARTHTETSLLSSQSIATGGGDSLLPQKSLGEEQLIVSAARAVKK